MYVLVFIVDTNRGREGKTQTGDAGPVAPPTHRTRQFQGRR